MKVFVSPGLPGLIFSVTITRHLLWARMRLKAEGGQAYEKGIHPDYHKVKVVCTSCGAEFESGSTVKGDELRVDTCSNCHPFFTGRQRFAAAQGRIEKFNRKYGLKNEE